jgi:D-alanyl-D-alanine carboxypeptidase
MLIGHSGNGPRITWTNVVGETYRLLTREEVMQQGEWSPLVTLSSDGMTATWTDEAAGPPILFYRLMATAETNWASKLQSALDRGRRSQGAKGVSAVVITTNGIWQGTSGISDTNADSSIQPQMRFSLGSITKTFTTALIMQLAEEGKLMLDDPLSQWLPDYPNITNTITIRQLLNHTSGIYNFTENPIYWPMVSKTNRVYTPQDVLGLVRTRYFLPGKGFHYSNTGFILLGLVAEAAGQDSVAEQIRSRFLQQLKLPSIYLEGSEPDSGTRAHGFSVNYTGSLKDITTFPLWTVEYPVAWTAGAMTATAYDLARWIRALYGGTVLKPESIEQMTEPTTLSGGSYGLGTQRFSTTKGYFWGHSGAITGYVTCAGHSSTRDATVVVLVNQDNVDSVTLWNLLVNAL